MFDLQVDVAGTPAAGTNDHPGQYAMLTVGEHSPMPFAIASGPGSLTFEFLIKGGTPLTDALASLPTGAHLQLSAAQGPGFPLDRAVGRDVLLFATGSGISAIRSTLLAIRERRARFGEVTLFFGARTPTAFAYLDEHSEWESDQIRVVRTVSQPGESGWTGLCGYVQNHVAHVRFEDAVVFICGLPQMVDQVREMLLTKGIPAENMFVNY